jgi:hypothetical protein
MHAKAHTMLGIKMALLQSQTGLCTTDAASFAACANSSPVCPHNASKLPACGTLSATNRQRGLLTITANAQPYTC